MTSVPSIKMNLDFSLMPLYLQHALQMEASLGHYAGFMSGNRTHLYFWLTVKMSEMMTISAIFAGAWH
jgi:hypothetical protein